MEIDFTHNIHPLYISIQYFLVGLLASDMGFYFFFTEYFVYINADFVSMIFYLMLIATGIGSLLWGMANIISRKTGRFPLGNYAVKRLLMKMYKPHGLPRAIVIFPNENQNKIIFMFGILFPVPLMPVEVRLEYDRIKDAFKYMNTLKRIEETRDAKRIMYIKDKNKRLMGAKIIKRDGTDEKLKDFPVERLEEAVFLRGLKPIDMGHVKNLYMERMHRRNKEQEIEDMERIWKDSMQLKIRNSYM